MSNKENGDNDESIPSEAIENISNKENGDNDESIPSEANKNKSNKENGDNDESIPSEANKNKSNKKKGDEYESKLKKTIVRIIKKIKEKFGISIKYEFSNINKEADFLLIVDKEVKHYFECKDYNSKLNLDKIAKIMLFTIKENPNSTTLVTEKGITPQADEYLQNFFYLENKLNKFNNNSINKSYFYIRNLENVYSLPFFYTNENAKSSDKIVNHYFIIDDGFNSWFHDNDEHIELKNEADIIFVLTIDCSFNEINKINIVYNNITLENIAINKTINGFAIKYLLTNIYSNSTVEKLIISYNSIKIKEISLPIIIKQNKLIQGDLRENTNIHNLNDDNKILIVKGEAGIGKSYFVKNLLMQYKRKFHNAIIINEDASSNNFNYFSEIIKKIFFKNIENNGQYNVEDFKLYINKFMLDDYIEINNQIIEFIFGNGKFDINYMPIIVKILNMYNIKIIIYFDNFSVIDNSMKELYLIIFTNLIKISDIYIIIEYREENIMNAAKEIIEHLNCIYNSIVKEIELNDYKIKTNELKEKLSNKLIANNLEYYCSEIIQKSGGNPLYIKNIINQMLDNNIIVEKFNNFTISSKFDFDNFAISEIKKYLLIITNKVFDDVNNIQDYILLLAMTMKKSYFELETLCKIFNINKNISIIKNLVSNNFLNNSENEYNKYNWCHDFYKNAIQLGVSKKILDNFDNLDNLREFMMSNTINITTNEDNMLIGNLLYILKMYDKAIIYYQQGYQFSNKTENLTESLAYLTKLDNVIPLSSNNSAFVKYQIKFYIANKFIDIGLHNKSLNLFEDLKNKIINDLDLIENNYINYSKILLDVEGRLANLGMLTMNQDVIINSCNYILDNSKSINDIFNAINRLMLLTSEYGFSAETKSLALLCLEFLPLLNIWDDNLIACCFIDISSVCNHEFPQISLTAFNFLHKIINNPINTTEYQKVETFSAELITKFYNINSDYNFYNEISKLKQDTDKIGLYMYSRINKLYGFIKVKEKDYKNAGKYFNSAKNVEDQTNVQYSALNYYSNMGILSTLMGDFSAAYDNFSQANVIISQLLQNKDNFKSNIIAIIDKANDILLNKKYNANISKFKKIEKYTNKFYEILSNTEITLHGNPLVVLYNINNFNSIQDSKIDISNYNIDFEAIYEASIKCTSYYMINEINSKKFLFTIE